MELSLVRSLRTNPLIKQLSFNQSRRSTCNKPRSKPQAAKDLKEHFQELAGRTNLLL